MYVKSHMSKFWLITYISVLGCPLFKSKPQKWPSHKTKKQKKTCFAFKLYIVKKKKNKRAATIGLLYEEMYYLPQFNILYTVTLQFNDWHVFCLPRSFHSFEVPLIPLQFIHGHDLISFGWERRHAWQLCFQNIWAEPALDATVKINFWYAASICCWCRPICMQME